MSIITLTKEDMWKAWRESYNQKGSMEHMSKLEDRTAREQFEQWWENNYSDE